MRIYVLLALSAAASQAQYKAEAAGSAPSELAPAIAAQLQKSGVKISGPDGGAFCEVWFREKAPGGTNTEENVSFTSISQGSLLGAIRFPKQGSDRRGQVIKPGVYTLRYSMFPINGDHQGAAPQRDFALMSFAAEDTDPAAMPNWDTLVGWSKKVSGTAHPAILSIWKQDTDFKPGLSKVGEQDWVLQLKMGDQQLAIILVGKTEA